MAGNPISDAVYEAVAARIRGASADVKALAAGLAGVFMAEVTRADKLLNKTDERWDSRADAMKARGVATVDKEYTDALNRYEKQIKAVEDYKERMLQLATKIAEDAIDG